MNILFEEFLDVLGAQAALYQSMLSVLDEENEAIIRANLEKVIEVNGEKNALVLKIQNLENQRLHMLRSLSDALGNPVKCLTLGKLSQVMEEPYSRRLEACRSSLLPLIEKVRKANDGNKSLLAHSIELVKGSMGLLNSLIDSNAVYYRSGKLQNSDKNGRVFSGEI
jgi:flagellar biosynthesis/type III secretory pathway chaperone